ncbi:unnamed protein product [Fraxinus pennsylvanica]|uniref:Uncharacterized protein n=1 Tax=Fraxinus pennsylvanica TaxID=56036 RepID=A0AAD2DXJ5_9LAMI|nr:unnamed protein product [Fraxinus pennsylvanica]
MVDPRLNLEFPVTSLNQAVGVAAMCLQDDPLVRPFICDVVTGLSFLAMAPPGGALPKLLSARTPSPSSKTSSEHTEDFNRHMDSEQEDSASSLNKITESKEWDSQEADCCSSSSSSRYVESSSRRDGSDSRPR